MSDVRPGAAVELDRDERRFRSARGRVGAVGGGRGGEGRVERVCCGGEDGEGDCRCGHVEHLEPQFRRGGIVVRTRRWWQPRPHSSPLLQQRCQSFAPPSPTVFGRTCCMWAIASGAKQLRPCPTDYFTKSFSNPFFNLQNFSRGAPGPNHNDSARWWQENLTSRSGSTGTNHLPLPLPPSADPAGAQRTSSASEAAASGTAREACRLRQASQGLPFQGGQDQETQGEGCREEQGRVLLWHDQEPYYGPFPHSGAELGGVGS